MKLDFGLRNLILIAACALVGGLPAGAGAQTPMNPAAPKRIVSFSLCADQYLLAFAKKEQVLALSRFARDRELSFYADKARRFPVTRSTVEEVVMLKPDLVIVGKNTALVARAHMKRLGFNVLAFPHPRTLEGTAKQIVRLTRAIGQPNRGLIHVRRLHEALRDLRKAGLKLGKKKVLYLQRRGFVTGGNTLIDELIRHAGLVNAAGAFQIRGFSRVALERIVAEKPDILIHGRSIGPARDQGSALLRHPSLRKSVARSAHIVLPVRQTVCPGPSILSAVKTLAGALENINVEKVR